MTILSYQIFKTVTETGSFQKAAEVLGLTPSAISHAVAAMEKELGFAVLTRGKGGAGLTNHGRELLPLVDSVLESEKNLQQAIAEIEGLKRGTVKVGCFASVCSAWIPDLVRRFSAKYPDVRVEVFQGTYDDIRELLKSGVVDIGFLSASSAGDLPIEIIYDDPLLCVTARDFQRTVSSEKMSAAELARYPVVAQRESTDADIQRFLKENGLELHPQYHVMDDMSGLSLVAGGLGVCILPELVVKSAPFDVKTYEMEPSASRRIGLAVPDPAHLAPAVREFRALVLECQ